MTFKISTETLSYIGADGFENLVAARIATLGEYDAHEATVRAHAMIWGMPDDERWVSLAIPAAPQEVDDAIRRTLRDDGTTEFTADYEIVGPSFEVKKAKLFDKVSLAERDAMAAVAPAGKVRAFQFREMDIRKADAARFHEAISHAPDPTVVMAFDEFTRSTRPEADTRFLEEQAACEDQRNEIMRWAASLHSDIEDLTPETIDAWEMKPFNG